MSAGSLALGVPLTVVSVLGLLLNGYILLVVVLTKQVQNANNLLLMHLGVVDSLLCVLFLLFSAPVLLRGGGAGAAAGAAAAPPVTSGGSAVAAAGAVTGPLCAVHGFLFTLLHPVALWTICGLNCDRYYAISAPLHYTNLVNTRKVAACLGASWVLALVMALPPLFISGPGYRYAQHGAAGCAPHFTSPASPAPLAALWYSGFYTLVTLLLPAALILACNLKILVIARYHRHRIASAIYEVTLSAQVTITHQRNPFYLQSQFKGRSAVVTVLQLLGSMLLLYFPYYGVIVWEAIASFVYTEPEVTMTSEAPEVTSVAPGASSSSSVEHQWSHVHPLVVAVASALLTCSPPINGFIYGVKSKVLRKTFANFWRKQMSKSEVNHEIQARTPSACGSRRPSLTPLGLLGRGGPPPSRRLSEVLLEPSGRFSGGGFVGCSPRGPRLLKRMATELSWRPTLLAAATSVDLNARMRRSRSMRDTTENSIMRGNSCNTLQVPSLEPAGVTVAELLVPPMVSQVDEILPSPRLIRGSSSTTNLLVQRVLLAPRSLRTSNTNPPRSPPLQRRSPQILITRAFSQERSESTENGIVFHASENDQNGRDDEATCSSTTALLADTGSSPESPEPPTHCRITSSEDETEEERHQPRTRRVCISLDDVSGTTISPQPSPAHQPASLPAVPAVVVPKRASWFRSLFGRTSSSSLMSWPLRSELSRRRADLAVATKSCSDVSGNSDEPIRSFKLI